MGVRFNEHQRAPWLIATAAAAALGTAAAAQPGSRPGRGLTGRRGSNVRAGVEAWQAGNYDEAIRSWRPLADRGDADAQYNLAQAYFLGRGVPQNMTFAEQWYARAARQGHEEAEANYGLLLFQNGRAAKRCSGSSAPPAAAIRARNMCSERRSSTAT